MFLWNVHEKKSVLSERHLHTHHGDGVLCMRIFAGLDWIAKMLDSLVHARLVT